VHWHGQGKTEENPKEMKFQERIGTGCQGNTGQLVVRTFALLKPLKVRLFSFTATAFNLAFELG
jgi:hypothetical protein